MTRVDNMVLHVEQYFSAIGRYGGLSDAHSIWWDGLAAQTEQKLMRTAELEHAMLTPKLAGDCD